MHTSKKAAAIKILRQCVGRNGVWADPQRYRFQCWTRDLVIAIMDVLIDIGSSDLVKKHLENLSQRQKPNGQIPILFLDQTLPFLFEKATKSLRSGKMSFMLQRFLLGQLWNLTPGTRDSEILYVLGMYQYADRTHDFSLISLYQRKIDKALNYVRERLMKGNLVVGCDWRDTMHKELGDKTLLTNNVLMYKAFQKAMRPELAERLKSAINTSLWDESRKTYLDYPGAKRFDPLGGAFSAIYGVAPESRYNDLAASFSLVDSAHGVTIKCRHNPTSKSETAVIEKTDGVVVWPFVVGFSVIALAKMGFADLAKDQFKKLLSLDGFYEWYDPETGRGYGAQQQLWSAMLFLRAARAIESL